MKQLILTFLALTAFVWAQNSSANLINAGWKSFSENDFASAEKHFSQAIAKDKEKMRAHIALSYMYQMQKKYEKAWNHFVEASSLTAHAEPYYFAAMMTEKAQFLKSNDPGDGVTPILKKYADIPGPLQATSIGHYGRWLETYGSINEAKQYYNKLHALTEWMVIGPFENISASGFDNQFAPEKEFVQNKTYYAKDKRPAHWFKIDKIRNDRWIDFTRYFLNGDHVFYANTFVYAPKKQTVQIRVGTSGSVKTFLNNALVLSVFDENNNDLDTYIIETTLQKGWNRLLVKTGNSLITRNNFMVRITDSAGNNPSGLIYSSSAKAYDKGAKIEVKTIENFAEKFFKKEIENNPQIYENYLLLADCYLRNDKAVEAEQTLLKLTKYFPNSVLPKKSLMEAYLRGEKYDEYNTLKTTMFDLYTGIPDLVEDKYSEAIDNQKLDKAEEYTNKYNQLLPNSATGLLMQMTIALRKGQVQPGLEILDKAYKMHPLTWDVVYVKALISEQLTKSHAEAIKIYESFLEKARTEAAYIALAKAALQESDLTKFEKTLTTLIEGDPSATGIYYYLSTVFLDTQNYEKAQKYIDLTLELCPGNSAYIAHQARIANQMGNKKEAIKLYKKALSYNDKNYEARELLRELEGKPNIFSNFSHFNVDSLVQSAPSKEKYPSENSIVLLDDKKRVVYSKGATEIENEILVRLFNSDGIDNFKEYYLEWYGGSQKLIVEKAVSIKADGREVKADINRNHIVFKSLEPNDFIYIKWRIQNFSSAHLAEHFSDKVNFNYYIPIENMRYVLLTPKDYSFKHKTQNLNLKPHEKQVKDGTIYSWYQQKVPAINYESDMPQLNDIGQVLFISTIPNWSYLVDWYKDLAATKTRPTFEVKEAVTALFNKEEKLSEQDKIWRVYDFITSQIRYSSVSFRQSGLIPQPARKVLTQKIGDCKDVATLCITMLAEVGIKANYVLVNTFDEGQNKNALPAIEFNHAIVQVETKNGPIYMDLTAPNYSVNNIPMADKDAFSLVIKEGVTKPQLLKSTWFEKGITDREMFITVKEDNSAKFKKVARRQGEPGARFIQSYRFESKDEQMKGLSKSIKSEFPNAKLNNFDIKNLDSANKPLSYSYTFDVPEFMNDLAGMKVISIPWTDALSNRDNISYETRNYPIVYRTSSDSLFETVKIELPKGYLPFSMEAGQNYECANASYKTELSFKDGVITATRQFVRKTSTVEPKEYQAFKSFYTKALKADKQQILIKK